jgi:hypothetical protein
LKMKRKGVAVPSREIGQTGALSRGMLASGYCWWAGRSWKMVVDVTGANNRNLLVNCHFSSRA